MQKNGNLTNMYLEFVYVNSCEKRKELNYVN